MSRQVIAAKSQVNPTPLLHVVAAWAVLALAAMTTAQAHQDCATERWCTTKWGNACLQSSSSQIAICPVGNDRSGEDIELGDRVDPGCVVVRVGNMRVYNATSHALLGTYSTYSNSGSSVVHSLVETNCTTNYVCTKNGSPNITTASAKVTFYFSRGQVDISALLSKRTGQLRLSSQSGADHLVDVQPGRTLLEVAIRPSSMSSLEYYTVDLSFIPFGRAPERLTIAPPNVDSVFTFHTSGLNVSSSSSRSWFPANFSRYTTVTKDHWTWLETVVTPIFSVTVDGFTSSSRFYATGPLVSAPDALPESFSAAPSAAATTTVLAVIVAFLAAVLALH